MSKTTVHGFQNRTFLKKMLLVETRQVDDNMGEMNDGEIPAVTSQLDIKPIKKRATLRS